MQKRSAIGGTEGNIFWVRSDFSSLATRKTFSVQVAANAIRCQRGFGVEFNRDMMPLIRSNQVGAEEGTSSSGSFRPSAHIQPTTIQLDVQAAKISTLLE